MKMSIWNLLTILLLVGTLGMVVIFGVIFILPNQVLPQGMRPIDVPSEMLLATPTETPFQFPPTWTKIPPIPTATNTIVPSKTATPTKTYTPSETPLVSGTPTETLAPSSTGSRTATKTKTPISIVVTGASKTATKTKVKTATSTPTVCPPGICGVDAIDDLVIMDVHPAKLLINVTANDLSNGVPIRITRLFDCANRCETDKFGNYTTHQDGNVKIMSDSEIEYSPAAGFMGMDSIDYKVTTEGGSVDIATVLFIVTDGTEMPPTDITSAPSPLKFG